MDLKGYYRKILEAEARLEEEFPILRSLATEEGGKAGRLVEVTRAVAARMIVDGIAELAGVEEAAEYRAESVRAREHEQERRRAEQIQFTILAERDIESLRKATRNARKD
jgi:hypothetical protein